nr:hypothetical protein CFP56_78637 [Quercus suber]
MQGIVSRSSRVLVQPLIVGMGGGSSIEGDCGGSVSIHKLRGRALVAAPGSGSVGEREARCWSEASVIGRSNDGDDREEQSRAVAGDPGAALLEFDCDLCHHLRPVDDV